MDRETEKIKELVDRLEKERNLKDSEFVSLLSTQDTEGMEYLEKKAGDVRDRVYGKEVYLRGLIEFTNYCKNNCRYCGIRRENRNAERYRLSREDILLCCDRGYELGFRTFVLQGGEDPFFNDERLTDIVSVIKSAHPDCAITLSVGERSLESYQRLFDAGACRYLLRHETANKSHYELLHPKEMSYENRMQCLRNLKRIGYQVGCGMMIGSPGQTIDHLIEDLRFLQRFSPEMVGIGPFIPHHDTEYSEQPAGTVEMTVKLLSVIRLILPDVLLPATTALGTIDPFGREKGIKAGANVVMPNLSPGNVRDKYLLYDNKICTGDEAAECVRCMTMRISKVGYNVVQSRGDHILFRKPNSEQTLD